MILYDLRNRLYHQGNSITVAIDEAFGYAQLSVDLLEALFDIDLTRELRRPDKLTEIEAKKDRKTVRTGS